MDPQAEIRSRMRERELNGKGRERVKRTDRASGGVKSEKNEGQPFPHPPPTFPSRVLPSPSQRIWRPLMRLPCVHFCLFCRGR